jgi:hypothetical protein
MKMDNVRARRSVACALAGLCLVAACRSNVAAPGVDAASGDDGGGDGGGVASVVKELAPTLFSRGDDPSRDPECTGVVNPERGVFQFHDLRSLGALGGLRAQGYSLIYGKVLLADHRARDLDATLLGEIERAFAAVRAAGLKVLPRFYYADDGSSPDAPIDRVLAHIAQLAPLWRANADVIAVLHPGFVGAWGEWHSSTNDLTAPATRKRIFDALLEALPPDRMTLTRRPSFKRDAYGGPLTAPAAFSGTALARIGHLNDCFLASSNDSGTYQAPGEEQYAVTDSAFVPVGGETCAANPPRSACPSALAELARLHWSFINTSYHPAVIQSWKDGGCFATITCRLGYRLALLRHESPASARPGDSMTVAVRLVNDGWAPPYNPRPVFLVLAGGAGARHVVATDADPRRWAPGETVDVRLVAPLPVDLPAGNYQLGIWMPDSSPSLRANSAYAVRISSGATWDPATGTNLLEARVTVTTP